jgi:hypothetical protein
MRKNALAAVLLLATLAAGATLRDGPANLLAAGGRAPLSFDGDVTGAPTDLLLDFAISPDPAVAGRALRAGRQIRITLPPAFAQAADAAPAVVGLLQGWPQSPVPASLYTVTRAGATLVVTARADIVSTSPYAPGIKGLELSLPGRRNPPPGRYRIEVAAETGAAGAVERGTIDVAIRGQAAARISVTSVFDQPAYLLQTTPPARASPIWQTAARNHFTPLPFNFLLWNERGEPLTGVDIEPAEPGSNAWRLVRGGIDVGAVHVSAPADARGQHLVVLAPSYAITVPGSLRAAARLRALFVAGDHAGEYVVTVTLHGGDRVAMHVRVAT